MRKAAVIALCILAAVVLAAAIWPQPTGSVRIADADSLGVVLEDSALGPLVLGVLEDSPAQRCGVHPGDVLTGLDDQQLHSSAQLEQQLASSGASCITVDRGGQQMRLRLHR